MSFIDGLGGGILSEILQIGLGAMTGGLSSMLTQAFQSLSSSIGNDVLQQVGQNLGLPQSAIEQAQSSFQNAAGSGGSPVQSIESAIQGLQSQGFSNSAANQLQSQAFNASQYLQQQVQQSQQSGDYQGAGHAAGGGRGAAGQDFLVALAEAMGSVIDNKMDQMVQLGQQIDSAQSSGSSQTAQLSAEMQADGQEVGMLSNALNDSIKSVGQAISTLASHTS